MQPYLAELPQCVATGLFCVHGLHPNDMPWNIQFEKLELPCDIC